MHFRSLFFASLLALSNLAHAEAPATFEVGSLTFARPSAWTWVPVTSPMRKAHLKVTGKEKDQTADITFFHFGPGMGGGVEANAKRWLGQFTAQPDASKIEPQEIKGTKVTVVTTVGTFASGMPGGPTEALPNQALLGVIIENPDGDVFVKMTGPAALINEQRAAFMDFIGSAIVPKK